MKKSVLAGLFLLLSVSANAAEADTIRVKTFEFEPSVGATYGLAGNTGSHKLGPSLGLEARWNLHRVPLDVGMQLYLGSACSRYNGTDLACRTLSVMPVCDYNFRRRHAVSPFVGMGVGLNLYDMISGDYNDYEGDKTAGVGLMPRVGVELFRHLRLALSAHVGKKIYSTVGLTVGYAIGGGRKK